jgi:hypothetical protein
LSFAQKLLYPINKGFVGSLVASFFLPLFICTKIRREFLGVEVDFFLLLLG